jgi:zinc/manganese transport system substrate-binding protein
MYRLIFVAFLLIPLACEAAALKVAVLHPLLRDLAARVGGERVEVIDLIRPNADPHHFEPKPEDLKRAEGASLYLVAGMGLEDYLPKLKAVLGNKVQVLEVGASLPPIKGADEDSHGSHSDPHWWHSIDHFRRATSVVAEALAASCPESAAFFSGNAEIYRSELDELERWARRELGKIPRDRRQLATAHAAFNYFCADYGFTALPVQGLNREQMPDPAQLANLVASLKRNHVIAIFPEKESNPKILQTLTTDTEIRLAGYLIADGAGQSTYQEFFRHNVQVIVQALAVHGR